MERRLETGAWRQISYYKEGILTTVTGLGESSRKACALKSVLAKELRTRKREKRKTKYKALCNVKAVR